MTRIRTFLDADVLIAAAKGTEDVSTKAMEVLDDPDRDFVTSDIIRLEVEPGPTCQGFTEELRFYQEFFASAVESVEVNARLTKNALVEACQHNLGACDALHVAAAKEANVQEFITAEKSTKPMLSVTGITVKTVRPAP